MPIVVGVGALAVAGSYITGTNSDYIAATERYDIEAWISYDSVDRHEMATGTDRGAQLYVYRHKTGNIQRVVFDYGMSHSNTLYSLLYKGGKPVKAAQSQTRYRHGKDGETIFCQPYPQAETNRIYFRGSQVICVSSEDKACEEVRSDPAKQEAILKGASELLRQLSAIEPNAEMPDVDFVKYL